MFHKSILFSTGLLKLIGTSIATGSVGVEFVGMVIFERVVSSRTCACNVTTCQLAVPVVRVLVSEFRRDETYS